MQRKFLSKGAGRSTYLLLLTALFLLCLAAAGQSGIYSQLTAPSTTPLIAYANTPVALTSNSRKEWQDSFYSPYIIEPSIWQENIQQKAAEALAGSNSNLLVVPFQSDTDNHEFDATTRALLTLTNTRALSGTKIKVADPILVAEALGANRSNYDKEKIAALAEQVNANQVLLSFVGHNEKNELSLHLELFDRHNIDNDTKIGWSQFRETARVSREGISFSPTNLPYYSYRKVHRSLLQELFGIELRETKSDANFSSISLNTSVQNFIKNDEDNEIASAKKLQFLALLHPAESAEGLGLWLYERSLVVLDSVKSTSDVDYLKAVALVALNRRPAALKLLTTASDTPQKKALLEYTNGNLIGSELLAAIPDSVERTSAQVRNQRLKNAYGVEPEKISDGELDLSAAWQAFVVNALEDGQEWRDTDSKYLKLFLDEIEPDKQFSFGSIMTRLALTRFDTFGAAMEAAILDHLQKIDFDSSANTLTVRRGDVLNLVRAQLVGNVYDKIYLALNLRELPEEAEDYIELYEPYFSGQPDFLHIASKTYKERADTNNITSQQAVEYREKAKEFGAASFLHANNTRFRTKFSYTNLQDFHKLENNLRQRIMRTTLWPRNSCQVFNDELEQCLENTVDGFHLLMNLVQNQPNKEKKAQVLAENHHRFKGNSSRLNYLFTTYEQLEDEKDFSWLRKNWRKQEILTGHY